MISGSFDILSKKIERGDILLFWSERERRREKPETTIFWSHIHRKSQTSVIRKEKNDCVSNFFGTIIRAFADSLRICPVILSSSLSKVENSS